MVFHWSLSDSKSPQVSRTLLSILAVLNNAVVWMVSTRPPTSKSSSPFHNPLVNVPNNNNNNNDNCYYSLLMRVFHIRTLLSILAVLNNVVVWMVSTRPTTSKSSSPFSNPLVTVPNAPITVGIIVTCMFHSLFNSQARSLYLSFFSHSFSFILWSAGTAKSTIFKFIFLLLIIIRSGLQAEIRWCVCQSPILLLLLILLLL